MSFWGALTGSDQKKALGAANKDATGYLKEGYDAGQGFYGQAADAYQPFMEDGTKANDMYGDAIGLGTDAERTAAQDRYFSDPAFGRMNDMAQNASMRYLNARGQAGGGKAALAGARVADEQYGSWLDRLKTKGSEGLQAASGYSGVKAGQGDMAYGYGATRAGNRINYGNAQAQAAGIGINNMLSLAGTAVKAYAASDIRLKRDIERVGALPSGLPVYRFRYLTGDEEHIGVMAHEARELFPHAVAERPDGFLMVDYASIG